MVREQILSVPNKIYPGQSEDLINMPMTDYNDLRRAMLVKPEILDAVTVMFMEQSGMISEILAYTGGYMGESAAYKNKRMESSVQYVGNHEIAWRVRNPKGYVYKFTKNAEGLPGIPFGQDGTEFYVFPNRLPLESDDVIELADGNTHLMLTAPPEPMDVGYKCRVRLNHTFRGQIVPDYLVARDVEFCLAYNLKPEASEHGSKVRVSFGSWMRNYLSTMRWEWNVTGTAAHTKLHDVNWFVYTNSQGQMEPYWAPVLDMEVMSASMRHKNHFLWNGKRAANQDGSPLRDSRGRTYFSGDGAYTQCSKMLRIGYNELTWDHIEAMMKNVKLDSLEIVGQPESVILGGLEFRLQFDKLLRQVFKLEPSVFFHAQNGEMGVKSNFRFYEHGSLGRIYILDADFFDSKFNASLYDENGNRYQSHRGVLVNVSKLVGGQQTMTLVSRKGRQNVVGTVNGMSNPGPGGVLTTTADVQGKHFLTETGICVHNPYCMGEFYKPVRRAA